MFVHLRLHTEFSVVDGINRIDEVVAAAAADGQPALAITDLNNLFGAVKFYKAARALGVKPLIGAEVQVDSPERDQTPHRLLLLAQNRQGYLNLCQLLSRGWTRAGGPRMQGVLQWAWLTELHAGLVALSGAQAGPLGAALLQGDAPRAERVAREWAALFAGRFYIELQRAGRADDELHVGAAVALAARLGLPVVATHPVQFLRPDDHEAHEARVCIAEGEMLANPRRLRRFTPQQYFKTAAEMEALFADLPSSLANTRALAERCSLMLELGRPQLPDYPTPLQDDGQPMAIEAYFRAASRDGLEARLAQIFRDAAQRDAARAQYQQRLAFEIDTIIKMGFPGYFLIVADFINWARNNGCPVGPGRGSGAGSLVAYALGITDLDPLQYKLLFERFLNPERVSMPDFDIDFCQGNRDRVIDYVKAKYGRDAVSQIATFGTLAARAAIRDVGRVLGMSYSFCDGISKLIPNKPGQVVTLQYPPALKDKDDKRNYAIEMEPLLAQRIEAEEDVRTLIELAQKLEGITRNVGMHAGGVLIAPSRLTDFCPLYAQPGSESAVSQYDKDDVEAIGLVKFDFLGLATLTILELAKEMIRARHPERADFRFEDLPFDDAATYRLFAEARTEAVFQFESRGMQGMLREARPSRLEDLIAMNALFRPGPMDLIPSYIARKHGREPVVYPDPRVEAILAETCGIMVYQEQVMQMAQILGGYSLGGADLLRRAMGKKKKEEMDAQRAVFRAGALKNGIDQPKADEIFDLMEKFAGYGFNKSHSAAYAVLAYHTAWLKVHYPAEFYAANMTVEMDDTDKLRTLWEDARRQGVGFEPPDINRGGWRFEPVSDGMVRYGLTAVKGTGRQAVDAIVAAREAADADGPFKSLFDFCARVDKTRVNKRTVEALVKAGAFDRLCADRAALAASIDRAFDYAAALEASANQSGLFDLDDSHAATRHEPERVDAPAWSIGQRLAFEKAAIGFCLSGHLFEEHEREVRCFVRRRLDELSDSREPVTVAGIVSDFRVVNTQRGRLGIFRLDDGSAEIEVTATDGLIDRHRALLKDDALVIVQGRAMQDRFGGGGMRFTLQQMWSLPQARCRFGKYLKVAVNGRAPDLAALLREHPPRHEVDDDVERVLGIAVRLEVQRGGAVAELHLGEASRFYPSDEALASWQAQSGHAVVVYE